MNEVTTYCTYNYSFTPPSSPHAHTQRDPSPQLLFTLSDLTSLRFLQPHESEFRATSLKCYLLSIQHCHLEIKTCLTIIMCLCASAATESSDGKPPTTVATSTLCSFPCASFPCLLHPKAQTSPLAITVCHWPQLTRSSFTTPDLPRHTRSPTRQPARHTHRHTVVVLPVAVAHTNCRPGGPQLQRTAAEGAVQRLRAAQQAAVQTEAPFDPQPAVRICAPKSILCPLV